MPGKPTSNTKSKPTTNLKKIGKPNQNGEQLKLILEVLASNNRKCDRIEKMIEQLFSESRAMMIRIMKIEQSLREVKNPLATSTDCLSN